MPFPVSLTGSVSVYGPTVDQTIERLTNALGNAKARALRREGNKLRFQGGMFRLVSSWNVLNPISRGFLEISSSGDGVRIGYRVTFSETIITSLITVAVAFYLLGTGLVPVASRLVILCVFWLLAVGSNFLITMWRLPRFLVRSLPPDLNEDFPLNWPPGR